MKQNTLLGSNWYWGLLTFFSFFLGVSPTQGAVVAGDISADRRSWRVTSPVSAMGVIGFSFARDSIQFGNSVNIAVDSSQSIFFRGSDTAISSVLGPEAVSINFAIGSQVMGAVASDDNFLIVDYNRDGVFETILQFDFSNGSFLGEFGSSELVGYAVETDTTNSIISGVDFNGIVTGAGVPEPSISLLGGLALTFLGLHRTRRSTTNPTALAS